MEIIVIDRGNNFKRVPFSPEGQKWLKQNPPAEYCFINHQHVSCFVKRQKSQFSGWGLLVKAISEAQIKNTPKITSLAHHQNYYYYFTEKLEGLTLDDFIKKNRDVSKLNLNNLVNNVFVTLRHINQLGFWYSDLCRKNIFVLDSGDFNLIDMDSCVHSTVPFSHRPVANEYQPLLTVFAKEVMNKADFNIIGLAGECLNQAEIIAMAVDSKQLFRIPLDKKIPAIHKHLMHSVKQEYENLFVDLIKKKPDWGKTKAVIEALAKV